MIGRFFERLQQRVRGLFARAVGLIDQEDAAAPMQWFKLGAFLQKTHLRNADLPQRPIRSEGQEIRMRTEEERIVIPFIRGQFLPGLDQFYVLFEAEIVVLDPAGRAEQTRDESPRERGFAQPLQPREKHRLRDAFALDHALERRLDVQVAPKIFKHGSAKSP